MDENINYEEREDEFDIVGLFFVVDEIYTLNGCFLFFRRMEKWLGEGR